MKKIAKFGYTWEHIPSGEIKGTSIEVNTAEELGHYKEVKPKKEPTQSATPYYKPKRGTMNNE